MLPHEIQEMILTSVAENRHVVEVYTKLRIDMGVAENYYKREYAKAYLEVSGTAGVREAQCDLLVQDERETYCIAKAAVDAQAKLVECRKGELSALQTLASNMRQEMSFAGKGE